MNTVLLSIILIPILEIYFFIKIGAYIGAFNTIVLIFLTAGLGIFYARLQGLNTLRSGLSQLVKNQIPAFEMISGTVIAFAAILLIIPGFMTDIIGFLLLIPFTRNFILKNFSKNIKKQSSINKDFIEGEYKDLEDDDDRKF